MGELIRDYDGGCEVPNAAGHGDGGMVAWASIKVTATVSTRVNWCIVQARKVSRGLFDSSATTKSPGGARARNKLAAELRREGR